MKKETIIKGYTLLATTYGKDINENIINVWFDLFKEDDDKEFERIIGKLLATSEFMPVPATIKRMMVNEKTKDMPSAEDEWLRVIDAVHRYGSYREEEALNSLGELTRNIVRQIGYFRICTASMDEQSWNKKNFIGEYNTQKEYFVKELMSGNKDIKYLN